MKSNNDGLCQIPWKSARKTVATIQGLVAAVAKAWPPTRNKHTMCRERSPPAVGFVCKKEYAFKNYWTELRAIATPLVWKHTNGQEGGWYYNERGKPRVTTYYMFPVSSLHPLWKQKGAIDVGCFDELCNHLKGITRCPKSENGDLPHEANVVKIGRNKL